MKKINLYKYILFLFPLFTIACEDIIDVELRPTPVNIVIEGNIPLDSLAVIKISTTKDFANTNEYVLITDAVVKLWDDAGNSEILQANSKGYYIANAIRGKEYRTYNLSVVYNEKEYTSTSTMPPLVMLDSLTLFTFPVLDYPSPMVHFTHPLGKLNDYYKFYVSVNGKRQANRYDAFSGDLIDNSIEMHLWINVPHEPGSTDDPVKQGDILTVEMQCIDKDVSKFWESLLMIENSLTNPTSNIKGGALGYFSAYSHMQMSIKAEW